MIPKDLLRDLEQGGSNRAAEFLSVAIADSAYTMGSTIGAMMDAGIAQQFVAYSSMGMFRMGSSSFGMQR